MAMSRKPPAFRAVTVPPSLALVAMAMPRGISVGAVTATGAAGRAGAERGGEAGRGGDFDADGCAGGRGTGFGPAGFDPDLEGRSGTGRLPGSEIARILGPS